MKRCPVEGLYDSDVRGPGGGTRCIELKGGH